MNLSDKEKDEIRNKHKEAVKTHNQKVEETKKGLQQPEQKTNNKKK
jgi:hypothetical protein